jgi:tetraacyldisaccharide 4'-kinase
VEILDLRSPGVKLVERIWRSRPRRSGPLATATALVTRLAIRVRVAARARPPSGTLVVSVGNLALGGTGKTPVVRKLGLDLAARGRRGAVLSRGYGSPLRGPLEVAADDERAGDELRLLAAVLVDRGWTVLQARNRRRGLNELLRRRPELEIVLVEDGFQTAGVPRQLDVLILDRWREAAPPEPSGVVPEAGPVFPWGPYREDASSARRAAIWLLETDPGSARLRASAAPATEVVGFRRRPILASSVAGPHGLVAGIAVPERFEADAARLLGGTPVLTVRCDDHCRYTPAVVDRIIAAGAHAGVRGWLTTEKDWVKLAPLWPATKAIAVLGLDVVWTSTPTLPDLVEERLRAVAGGGVGAAASSSDSSRYRRT